MKKTFCLPSENLVIFYPDPHPDPLLSKMRDPDPYPDPHIINVDPKRWFQSRLWIRIDLKPDSGTSILAQSISCSKQKWILFKANSSTKFLK
jgi:hypothetical protein